MHDWLLRLTRPEDHLLWIWLAVAAGYAVVGLALGGTLGRAWAHVQGGVQTRLRGPGVRRSSR